MFYSEETMPSDAVPASAAAAPPVSRRRFQIPVGRQMHRLLPDLLLALAVALMMAMLVWLTRPCPRVVTAPAEVGAAAGAAAPAPAH
jgi:hypothetical protein